MEFHKITTGTHLEGLAHDGENLWFSDVMAGGIHRLADDGSRTSWRDRALCIGGLLVNQDGRILSTGEGGISWTDPASGASGMLIDQVDGKPIPGVNEMAVDRDGGIVFGAIDIPGFLAGRETAPSTLYRLSVDGEVTVLCQGLNFANGLAFSADRRRLYFNDSFAGTHVCELDDRGEVADVRMLLEKPDCDGIKVDTRGRVWVTGFSSDHIVILDADGKRESEVPLPADACTNLLFAGPDGRDLYITTVAPYGVDRPEDIQLFTERESTLYRARAPLPGLAIPRTRFKLP